MQEIRARAAKVGAQWVGCIDDAVEDSECARYLQRAVEAYRGFTAFQFAQGGQGDTGAFAHLLSGEPLHHPLYPVASTG